MAVVLKCPACEQKFRWEFAEQQRWPKACPMCRAEMGGDDDDTVICMPALRGAATKAHDDLYRQMEKGSEVRAQAAAEQLGVPVSEMSSLKVTDMLDNRKQGEISAPSVAANEAALSVAGSRPQFAGDGGAGYSGAVQTGPMPNAGARMRTALQTMHGSRFGGDVVSDRPALETQAPGYRRRG